MQAKAQRHQLTCGIMGSANCSAGLKHGVPGLSMMGLWAEYQDSQGRPCLQLYKSFNQERVLIMFAFEINPFGSRWITKDELKVGKPVRKQVKELK